SHHAMLSFIRHHVTNDVCHTGFYRPIGGFPLPLRHMPLCKLVLFTDCFACHLKRYYAYPLFSSP
ncbi:MAG: hypothetical protein RR431_06670, partial [Clostridia bacterium]